jgi:hypothetical protein
MTTFAPPKRHASSFLHRHHSSISHQDTSSNPAIFQGTDTVVQNRKVAVQRIVEVHDALELTHHAGTALRNDSASVISSDSLSHDFTALDLPHGEVRAFRYFLRKWDASTPADTEFDAAVSSSSSALAFDEAAIRHFFRRIALWNESDDVLAAARSEMETRDKRRARDGVLGRLWSKEKSARERDCGGDELKEVVTREGLAQLLWTLMHDWREPLAPRLLGECNEAVKRKYGIVR